MSPVHCFMFGVVLAGYQARVRWQVLTSLLIPKLSSYNKRFGDDRHRAWHNNYSFRTYLGQSISSFGVWLTYHVMLVEVCLVHNNFFEASCSLCHNWSKARCPRLENHRMLQLHVEFKRRYMLKRNSYT